MNIILDPGLLWFDKTDEHENFIYLEKVIDFIDTYLDMQYLPIFQFVKQLYQMAKDPLGEYRESEIIKNDKNEIILLIISAIKENLKPITLNTKEQQ